ncbi:UNVERIFIED_CONTAM: hypothetical protein K2H54_032561 [Gekko kuhli]
MEVDDRISYLEQRLQLQEDEIQVLKAALADVLRRLTTCEENGLSLQKRGPSKVYQLLRGLPSRPSLSNGIVPQRRGYSTSPSSPKRELLPGKSGRSSSGASPERPAWLIRRSVKDQRSRTPSSSGSSCGGGGKREGYV